MQRLSDDGERCVRQGGARAAHLRLYNVDICSMLLVHVIRDIILVVRLGPRARKRLIGHTRQRAHGKLERCNRPHLIPSC